jgi:UDP-glucuronate 4-epimerase
VRQDLSDFTLPSALFAAGAAVFGLDNLNDYYSVDLKKDRLKQLQQSSKFHFEPIDLADGLALDAYFKANKFTHVVNLAAQAGVRYSLINPKSYIDSNIVGFANLLECCRHNDTGHLVYASSSSVYGLNTSMPFSVHDNVDHPVSLYAASKKSNELMAHTYSYLYKLPTTGLRFFTVYGPWGRPDMALYLFTKAICEGKPINVFNHGKMRRDFTYIDDIVEGVFRIVSHVPQETWAGTETPPIRAHPRPPTKSTTSATTTPSNWSSSSPCWKTRWEKRPCATTWIFSPETCPRPTPISTT